MPIPLTIWQRTSRPAVMASTAAEAIVPHTICCARHWNVWSSSGASMQPAPGYDDDVAVDDLGGTGSADVMLSTRKKIAFVNCFTAAE